MGECTTEPLVCQNEMHSYCVFLNLDKQNQKPWNRRNGKVAKEIVQIMS